MRIKIIACKVLMRELYSLCATSGNVVDILWLKQALHTEPEKLRRTLQHAIEDIEAEEEQYDAICIGYGLCSNGVVGLKTQKTPLVLPRAHDCISLLLGSKERYQELFESASGGIYWYSPGWMEHSLMPGRDRYDKIYAEYLEKYGEDNADYLMEMEQGWMKDYSNAYYIDWPSLHSEEMLAQSKEAAAYLDWKFSSFTGEDTLLKALVEGWWDAERFLVLSPGEAVAPSYREDIIKVKDA